ncbi:hypothetical protein TRIP_B110031 [uncultured Desulfatiglans sp.]|nr:hypothetical protein TRIP_B110031 [uncultured Desulfatiglans sp.]
MFAEAILSPQALYGSGSGSQPNPAGFSRIELVLLSLHPAWRIRNAAPSSFRSGYGCDIY